MSHEISVNQDEVHTSKATNHTITRDAAKTGLTQWYLWQANTKEKFFLDIPNNIAKLLCLQQQ